MTGEEDFLTPRMAVDSMNIGKSIPQPILTPALSPKVKLSLTCGYISIFGLIFLLVYAQLWMIWYYRHRRLSHQTLFLYLCLIWSGLRTSLFSLYFDDCSMPNRYLVLYCLMYVFPVCLQFSMLCLLLHFFAQVVLKSRAKYEPGQYKKPLRIFLGLSVIVFTGMNLAFAVLTKRYEGENEPLPSYFLYLRVTLTESMFLIYGILFSMCIGKMTTVAASRRVLEARGTTVCRSLIANILITALFLSRTIYNLITCWEKEQNRNSNFGYDWIDVSDQADQVSPVSQGLGYISFGIVLFVWEVLPITIVVIYFRVKRHQTGPVMTDFSTQNNGSRVFFFDNPRRYDSVDDLATQDVPSSSYDVNSARFGSANTLRSFPGDSSLPASFTSAHIHRSYGSINGLSPHPSPRHNRPLNV